MAFKMKPKSPFLKKVMGIKAKMKDFKTGETTYKGGYTFDEAFADARKSGAKEFTYKGKKYNTKLKSPAKKMSFQDFKDVGKLSADSKQLAKKASKDPKVTDLL